MQTNLLLLSVLTLLATPPLQESVTSKAPETQDGRAPAITSDESAIIGLTFFVPKEIEATRLIGYAEELLRFKTISTNDTRKRFVQMESAIGVHGTSEERELFIAMLSELDAQLGDLEEREAANVPKRITRTLRINALAPTSVEQLLRGLTQDVSMQVIEDLGVIVLDGSEKDIERVARVLAEIDRPQPQMRLYCEVIAAREPDAPGERVGGEIGAALAPLHPGKSLISLGRAMVRGSVGGVEPLTLTSVLTDPSLAKGATRRLHLEALATGWDAKAGTLTLGACDIRIEDWAQGVADPTTSQSLSASFTLNADETTVVGSLGGVPMYVVIRYTPM